MPFKEWGEEPFIAFLAENFPTSTGLVGIGDDCAVIPREEGMAWLVTTDAIVEGVHFIRNQIPPKELGYKVVAASVSDISAMGGISQYLFLTMAIPKLVEPSWVKEVVEGVKEACAKWDLQLLGGDTVGSLRDFFLNGTIVGSAEMSKIRYRKGAASGDLIAVTGNLGDSGAGLSALQEKTAKTEDVKKLIHVHFHPEPYPEQGFWLAAAKGVHAMIDISDGLDCDLKRLMACSKQGAVIDMEKIPLSPELCKVCTEQGWDPLKFAITGGEDYRLLFTIAEEDFAPVCYAFYKKFGTPLYAIGKVPVENVQDMAGEIVYEKKGIGVPMSYACFDHFQ